MTPFKSMLKVTAYALLASFLLISCKNNITLNVSGGSASVKLGGIIYGLNLGDQLGLQNNGGSILYINGSVSGTVSFEFPTSLITGESYYINISSSPALKTCIASGNAGTAGSTDIRSVVITCNAQTGTYTVGGSVSNLLGWGLVLKNTHLTTENFAINPGANPSPFVFATLLADAEAYTVTVATQPTNPSQTCSVTANGAGTIAAANVTGVAVNCVTNQYTVSGTISNLLPADTVTLRNNGNPATDQTITGAVSSFTFAAANDGTSYNVTIVGSSGPSGCTVTNGAGTLAGGPISNVSVVCSYAGSGTVAGTVAGLATGATLVLHNGAENLILTTNGAYSFITNYPNGTAYNVTITNPMNPSQACTFNTANNTGIIPAAGVNITCVTNQYTVGGTVSGLGAGTVTLLNNGVNSTPVVANGAFSFATPLNSGSVYNVTVASTTGGITCNVGSGIGVVTAANVTGVTVTCSASATYSIGGVITGLPSPIGSSTGITLKNNGVDTTVFLANGNFTFPATISNGGAYNVTISAQPTLPGEVCSILNPSGTVNGANVTSVVVTCSINTYTVGGTINWNGNTGSVTLQYNGGNNTTINSPSGVFTFPGAYNDFSSYNVSVLSTTGGITCTSGSNTGSISGGNVSNVSVTCSATPLYTIGVNITGFSGSTSLMLANNGTNYLAANVGGVHSFSVPLATGATYSLTIVQQPTLPKTACSFTGSPTGTIAASNVSVAMSCSVMQYSVGGTVTGLANTETITLQNNAGNNTVVTGAGGGLDSFTFSTVLNDMTGYNVSILTPPAGKTCTAGANTGSISGANVTNVTINCSVIPRYSVGGAITGLGTGTVTLRNNGGDDLVVSANGVFTFATTLVNTAAYNVTVFAQPASPNKVCTVTSGSGTIAATNVTGVSINCVTTQYFVRGTLSGLTGTDTIKLLNNGADSITLAANGAFNFALQNDGTAYNVTIQAMPATSTCSVGAGTGTIAGANVTTVTVTCSAAGTFSIGGTVSGLIGTSVQVSLNGGLSVATLNANGVYSFGKTLSSGTIYSVAVTAHPTAPTQTCTVANPNGTVAAAVGNIDINCVTNTYKISGTVTGLATSTPGPMESFPLLFGNSSAVIINGDAPAFMSAPINDGTSVTMQIINSPYGKKCTFTTPVPDATLPAGTYATVVLNGANYSTVAINCAALTMASVNVTVTGLSGTSSGLGITNYISIPGSSSFTNGLTFNSNATQSFITQPELSYYTVVVSQQPTGGPAGEVCYVTGTSSGQMAGPAVAVPVTVNCVNTGGGGANTVLNFGAPLSNQTVAVGATNQYEVTGLVAGTLYNFSLTALTGDANLFVFSDAAFSTFVCSSTNAGTSSEQCSWTGSTKYYIKVVNNSVSPVSFTIRVSAPSIICGNNIVEAGETCDDGNTSSFDGCSVICQLEVSYTLGGTISGLGAGDSVTLRNGTANQVVVSANGSFTFPVSVVDGAAYYVVKTAGTHPGKTCTVDPLTQSGTVSGANVTSIVVNCIATPTYLVSGKILGLASGKTATVTLNATETTATITGTAGAPPQNFSFVTPILDGGAYSVVVNPGAGVTCAAPTTVTGTINGANVTTLGFSCSGATVVPDAYEVDSMVAPSVILPNGVDQYRTFDTLTDVDYVKLVVDTTSLSYTIGITQAGAAPGTCTTLFPSFQIWDSTQTQLLATVSNLYGPSCAKTTLKFPSTGNYYLKIWEPWSTKGNYNVNVKRSFIINRETFDTGPGQYTSNVLAGVTPPPYNKWWHATPGITVPYNYESINANWVPFYSDGNYMVADSWNPNLALLDTELVSPKLNCSMAAQVFVSFDLLYKDLSTLDFFYVDVRSGGGAWVNVVTYTTTQSYIHPEFNITAQAAGKADVEIRFRYLGNNDYYSMLDNITVVGQ